MRWEMEQVVNNIVVLRSHDADQKLDLERRDTKRNLQRSAAHLTAIITDIEHIALPRSCARPEGLIETARKLHDDIMKLDVQSATAVTEIQSISHRLFCMRIAFHMWGYGPQSEW